MRTIFTVVIAVSLGGCGGTGANIDAEGCTYLDNGPFRPVSAGMALDTTAPAIAAEPRANTITLPTSGIGYLAFDSPDDTEYAVFTSRAVTFATFSPTGTPIPPSASTTTSSECTTIQGRHIVELAVGHFYFGLGPDTGGPVNFVLRPYNPD